MIYKVHGGRISSHLIGQISSRVREIGSTTPDIGFVHIASRRVLPRGSYHTVCR